MVRRDPAVRLLTRNGRDWTARFPLIFEAAGALQGRSFLIDGEAVACDGNGMPVFDRLRYRHQDGAVFLFAFDLLELEGRDLRREPIEIRKRQLATLLRAARVGLQLNEHISESGDVVFKHACKMGLEGIVSKRLGSHYRSGRSSDWRIRRAVRDRAYLRRCIRRGRMSPRALPHLPRTVGGRAGA